MWPFRWRQYTRRQLEQARALVVAARINATGLFDALSKRFPKMWAIAESNLIQDWDHLVTIASVGTAFSVVGSKRLGAREREQRGLCYAMQAAMDELDQRDRTARARTLPSGDPVARITNAMERKPENWAAAPTYDVLVEFLHFVYEENGDLELPDAIGIWLWLNLGKAPGANDRLQELAESGELVRPVGFVILQTFGTWWRQ